MIVTVSNRDARTGFFCALLAAVAFSVPFDLLIVSWYVMGDRMTLGKDRGRACCSSVSSAMVAHAGERMGSTQGNLPAGVWESPVRLPTPSPAKRGR